MNTEEVCTKLLESSDKNQKMWDCVSLMGEYPHWSGPFFTGIVICLVALVIIIATAR